MPPYDNFIKQLVNLNVSFRIKASIKIMRRNYETVVTSAIPVMVMKDKVVLLTYVNI